MLIKISKKRTRKTANEVYNEEKLKRKSIYELKEITKLGRIQSRGKLKKEGLITRIIKTERSNAERNYMKHFNTNVDNYNVDNNANDDYNGQIKDKISNIRVKCSRLGDIVTKDDREKIKIELYEIENKKNLSIKKKKRLIISK